MIKNNYLKRFTLIAAVFTLVLSTFSAVSIPAKAVDANGGGIIQSVTTLAPDLVGEQFAVVGGQVSFDSSVANKTATPTRESLVAQGALNLHSSPESQADHILRNSNNSNTSDSGSFVVGWVEYGTTPSSMNQFSSFVFLPFNGNETKEFRVALNSLQATTAYHYRAVALTVYGVERGQNMTFTTGGTGSGNYTLTATPNEVNVGDPIAVQFNTSNSVNSNQDWIGMFKVGNSDREYAQYRYTDGRQSGEFTFTPTQPGLYEFRYFLNNGFSRTAVSNTVTVRHPGGSSEDYTVQAVPSEVAPGSTITVTFTHPTNRQNKHDWIGMYRVDANDREYITYKYVDSLMTGSATRTMTFTAPGDEGTYNFRYFINNGYHRVAISNEVRVSGTVSNAQAPLVTTKNVQMITESSAQFNATVNPKGSNTTAWFEWGQASSTLNMQTPSQFIGSASSSINVFRTVTGLQNNTTYFYRIAAQNTHGISRGDVIRFTTGQDNNEEGSPLVTTRAALAIGATGATFDARVNPKGSNTTAWFEWGTQSNSLLDKTTERNVGSGNSEVTFTESMTNLQPNTTYYFKVVAENEHGITRGSTLAFRTTQNGSGDNGPGVTTQAATEIDHDSARLNAIINPEGRSSEAWFEWGISSTNLNNQTIKRSAGSGNANTNFSETISGLSSDTTYYFRSHAQNSEGIVHGSVLSFRTSSDGGTGDDGPQVTTRTATSIGLTSLKLNADVNPRGTATTAWFEWGTSTNALSQKTPEQSVGSGNAVVAINRQITALASNTTYFFRVVARNTHGESQGAVLAARTSGGGTSNGPYVITVSPTAIQPGQSVTVHFEAPSNHSARDWVGLYREGENDRSYRTYQYTGNGGSSGNLTFRIDEPGSYEFRYFLNNGYTLAATSERITVGPIDGGSNGYTLNATPTQVQPQQTITVEFDTPDGTVNSARDWVGMYQVDANDRTYLTWKYTNGVANGSMSFTAPATNGTYEFRYFLNNGYTRSAKSNQFTVGTAPATASLSGPGEASLGAQSGTPGSSTVTTTVPGSGSSTGSGDFTVTTDTTQVQPGVPVTVSFTAPASEVHSSDWIGVYKQGLPDTKSYVAWKYTRATQGTLQFTINEPGTYEFRYYRKNGYTRAATSQALIVGLPVTQPVEPVANVNAPAGPQ